VAARRKDESPLVVSISVGLDTGTSGYPSVLRISHLTVNLVKKMVTTDCIFALVMTMRTLGLVAVLLVFLVNSSHAFYFIRKSLVHDLPRATELMMSGEEYPDFLPHPHPSVTPEQVVRFCMDTFVEYPNNSRIGLEVCFAFSSDQCRAALGGSFMEFTEYAQNPTFQYLITSPSYSLVSIGPIIPGTAHRGSMQTVLMEIDSKMNENDDTSSSSETARRRFLWTLQQERRPPLQDCWMIREVLYVKNAFHQTV
jgi:hypothetical protein